VIITDGRPRSQPSWSELWTRFSARTGQRAAAATVASEANAQLVQLHCTASPDLARRRMAARRDGVSDADAEIARHMGAAMTAWPAATTLDTEPGGAAVAVPSCAFGDIVQRALDTIRPHGPEHVWRPSRPVLLPD
jgi:hypothetical protein